MMLVVNNDHKNFPFHNREDRLSIRYSDFRRIDFGKTVLCDGGKVKVRVGIRLHYVIFFIVLDGKFNLNIQFFSHHLTFL